MSSDETQLIPKFKFNLSNISINSTLFRKSQQLVETSIKADENANSKSSNIENVKARLFRAKQRCEKDILE